MLTSFEWITKEVVPVLMKHGTPQNVIEELSCKFNSILCQKDKLLVDMDTQIMDLERQNAEMDEEIMDLKSQNNEKDDEIVILTEKYDKTLQRLHDVVNPTPTPKEVAFRGYVREYLEGLPRPIDSLVRTDIFDNIPMKVNKIIAWRWIKKEITVYDYNLIEKLKYKPK